MTSDQLKDYYEEMIADTEPGQPGGEIAWSSRDYATEEEEEAGLEAFIKRIMDKPYEEE